MCVLCILSLRSTQVLCLLSFRSSVFRLQCLPACAGLPRPPPSAYMRLHWAACGVEERGGAGGAAQPAGAKESSASTGAATEVGAGLSKKDRRTYWEPCAEGKEARRQWAPAFEAKVKGNEEAADAYWDSALSRLTSGRSSMPAMWAAPRLPATRWLRSLKISDCAVAKESAQAGRTLALFSLELSLELALRQSWSLTLRPFGMSCGSLAAELPGTVRLSE